MANPIMQQMFNSRQPRNPLVMLAEFKKFAQGMTPEKAQQQIQQLLSSGEMTQGQFQQLQAQAKDFMQFLK